MIEASAENVSRDVFRACLQEGVAQAERIADVIAELQQSRGERKRPLAAVDAAQPSDDLVVQVENMAIDGITRAYTNHAHHKVY